MPRFCCLLLVTRVSPFARASGDKSPPPVALRATPPARIPPTQTLFARGPGAVGIGAFLLQGGQEVFDFWLCCVIIFRALDDYQCGV